MPSSSSVAEATRRLSSYTVVEIARRTDAGCVRAVKAQLDELRQRMESRGVRASTYIHQAAPPGVHVGEVFCVVDRKAAYRYQLEHMSECPAARAVFLSPKDTLLEWSSASPNLELRRGVRADVDLLMGDGVPAKQRAERAKGWYKMAYGKLCNALTADKRMPGEMVERMRAIGELVRRRNALVLMDHASSMRGHFMAAYTDSVLLRGVDPAAAVEAMCSENEGLVWEVECVARVVALARINTHLFVLENGTVLTRPHEMFGQELANSGLDEQALKDFKGAVVDALTRRDVEAIRHIYDQIPESLEMRSAAGDTGVREPSVRRLLGHVLSACLTGPAGSACPSRKRKRGAFGAAGAHYAKLADAKRAQSAVAEPCFVVGEDRVGSKGLYRRWRLVGQQELVGCVGKPCHMTFVGSSVAYRVVVDYDEPRALSDEDVQRFADSVAAFWLERRRLKVSVRVLRTRTLRDGAKAHSEHLVFAARDEATGRECLLLNPEEIPAALGAASGASGSSGSGGHAVVDESIYKLGRSLRLPGCPKLTESGALDASSVHVPRECRGEWTPSSEEYASWSPCVLFTEEHVVHCDVVPAHDGTAAAREQCPFLFASENFFVNAFVEWMQRLCGEDYVCDQPKTFYWNKTAQNDPNCNSFILTVIFKSKTAKDKTFLDYCDFARRVGVPWLKRESRTASPSSCTHHGSNHSYFVFKVDTNPQFGQGELRGVNANTHHDARQKAQQKAQRRPKFGVRMARQTTLGWQSSERGAYMSLDEAAKSRIVGERAEEYEEMVKSERDSVLSVTLARRSDYDAEVRTVNAYRVRLALLRRHRAHQPGRAFPTEGRRDGWSEKRTCSHEDTVIAVAGVVAFGHKAVALRAVFTELKFYRTNFKSKRAQYVVQRLEELKDACDAKPEATDAVAPWDTVVRYANDVTYKNEVY